jgi:hypothetical protein
VATPSDEVARKAKDLGVQSHGTSFTGATFNPFAHDSTRGAPTLPARSGPIAPDKVFTEPEPGDSEIFDKIQGMLAAELATLRAQSHRSRRKTVADRMDSPPPAPKAQAPQQSPPGIDDFKGALENPAALQQLVRQSTKETKTAFAHAILADPMLKSEKKLEVLRTLTAPPQKRNDPNALTLDQVLKEAPKASLHGFNELLAGRDLDLPKTVATLTTPETLLLVASSIAHDQRLSDEQRSAALGGLMVRSSKERLNFLIDQAVTRDERNAFSMAILNIPFGDERAAQELNPANQQRLVDAVLTAPRPNELAGDELAAMFTSMTAGDRNKLIDHLQEVGNLPAFLESQRQRRSKLPEILEGLNAGNAAAFQRGFQRLADEARIPPINDPAMSAAYTRLADQVQSWATETSRGSSYVKQFVEARSRLER